MLLASPMTTILISTLFKTHKHINIYLPVGEELWMIDNAHPGGVLTMQLSHNRRFILTGGPAGEVRLWELRTRDLISHLKEHVSKVTSVALSQDDTFAGTCVEV